MRLIGIGRNERADDVRERVVHARVNESRRPGLRRDDRYIISAGNSDCHRLIVEPAAIIGNANDVVED